MRAAYIEKTGEPEVIQYGELPKPVPGPGEVLVRVAAAAVNPIDTYIRSGMVSAKLPRPYIIGCDLAGTVETVGEGVTGCEVGLRVWGSNQGLMGRQGTFAEYAVVGQEWLYPIPDGVGEDRAAALALVGITAHLGLFRCGTLRSGETVFVSGGTGGVGSTVVQMAKAVDAKVITTTGSAEKQKIARELGADLVLNYKTDDVGASIREFTEGTGVDVWYETSREPNFERTIPLMARRGRMIVMAGREAQPRFPVGPFYVNDLSLHGFAMFNANADEQRPCAEAINGWMASGRLKPLIGRTFALSEAVAAHRLQQENTLEKKGTLIGKIVVKPIG